MFGIECGSARTSGGSGVRRRRTAGSGSKSCGRGRAKHDGEATGSTQRVGHGWQCIGAPAPSGFGQHPGTLAGGKLDALGTGFELAREPDLHLPFRIRHRGDGAGQSLQAVLEVVTCHRVAARHARPMKQLAGMLPNLLSTHHHLDGGDVCGVERAFDLSDKRQPATGAVQKMLVANAIVESLDRTAVAQDQPQP
jgi:hypothetical protein